MNQCQSYEVQGLLNAGLDKNEQPIYVLLYNLIIQNKNEELIVNKFQSYLQQFRPFKGFVLVVCSQDDTQMNSKDVKNLIKQTIKKVSYQQLKRIDKLIVISTNQNYGKKEKSIPFTLKLLLRDKVHLINKINKKKECIFYIFEQSLIQLIILNKVTYIGKTLSFNQKSQNVCLIQLICISFEQYNFKISKQMIELNYLKLIMEQYNLSTSFLNLYDIELHQSVLRFLCNQIEFQEQLPFYGRDLNSYPIAQSGLPVFLEEILKFYIKNTDMLRKQGIFRLSGSHEEEIKLVDQLLQSNYEAINLCDPDVIATVLKNSLVNLKIPLFPFEIYAILRETNPLIPTNEFIDMFSIFFAHLPKVNRLTIFRLTEFIKYVATFEKENMMGLHNLSIIFAPCFFRTKSANELDLQGAKTIVMHFKSLIQNIDQFLELQKRLNL